MNAPSFFLRKALPHILCIQLWHLFLCFFLSSTSFYSLFFLHDCLPPPGRLPPSSILQDIVGRTEGPGRAEAAEGTEGMALEASDSEDSGDGADAPRGHGGGPAPPFFH